MPSIIGGTPAAREAAEIERRALTDDNQFTRKRPYFFELRIPGEAISGGGKASLFYPLLVNPQVYEIGDPFTLEVTPTLGGGVYTEESGILVRPIRIAGHTGFRPRPFPSGAQAGLRATNQGFLNGSIVDVRPRGRANLVASSYSGQMQLFFLQDRVFRLYGALKKNPKTSAGTVLVWHNIKDSEHWIVRPQEFTLRRAAPKSTMYFYEIRLLAVALGTMVHEDLEIREDRGWLDDIKNVRRSIRDSIDTIEGVITNLSNVVNEIAQEATNWVSLVNDLNDLAGAAANFVTGVTESIQMPFRAVRSAIDGLDAATRAIEAAVIAGGTVFDGVAAELREAGRAVDKLSLFGDRFIRGVESARKSLEDRGRTTETEAASATAATSLQAMRVASTAPGPGDAKKSNARRTSEPRVAEGAVEQDILLGDTAESLAARYLGDSTRWREIVALNRLRPPYFSATGIPGTLRPGDRVLIPSDLPALTRVPLGGLGVKPTAPEPERLYLVDLRLDPVRDATGVYAKGYDLVMSPSLKDFELVRGLKNLEQAIRIRTVTEQGSDPQYRNVGVPATIGRSLGPGVDEEILRIRFADAVAADPRIASVVATSVTNLPQADFVEVEITAAAHGTAERLSVVANAPRPGPTLS